MKIQCYCGHIIVDQSDGLAYKSFVLKDQDYLPAFDGFISEVISYIEAVRNGRMEEWLRRHSLQVTTPDGMALASILSAIGNKYIVDMYECEGCGRIYISTGTSSLTCRVYTLQDHENPGILRSEYQDGNEKEKGKE